MPLKGMISLPHFHWLRVILGTKWPYLIKSWKQSVGDRAM